MERYPENGTLKRLKEEDSKNNQVLGLV